MIGKTEILLRIKDFQQRTCRISAVIMGQFIYLIQHHHRIRTAAALHALHDTSRHCSDISSSVTTDLSLIPDTAKTDPHIFPVQCFGNTLADTGLTSARCTDKKQDRTRLLLIQCHHRNLLHNTLFYFFQTVMLLIQHLLCLI